MRPVVVVGSVNFDLVLRVPDLPRPGQTLLARSLRKSGGGKGANAALASARAGAPTSLVACVGDDDAATAALADLRAENVDLAAVQVVAGASTGTAVVAVDDQGENCIMVAAGANDALTDNAVQHAVNGAATGVVLTNLEIPDSAVLTAACAARGAGAALIVNPAPARALSEAVLAQQPILTPNEEELATLTGQTGEEGARSLHARSGAPVVVTLGPDGALVLNRDAVRHVPAPHVTPVDTSGAGDVFNGTFAAELAAGLPFDQAVAEAVARASAATLHAGARCVARTVLSPWGR